MFGRWSATIGLGIALLIPAAPAQPALAAHPGPDYVKTVVSGPTHLDVAATSLWDAIKSAELHFVNGVLRISYVSGIHRGEPLRETATLDFVRDVYRPITATAAGRLPELLMIAALVLLFEGRRFLARLVRRAVPRLHFRSR